MYFGSRDPHVQTVAEYANGFRLKEETWVPAIYVMVREIIDNAIDEVVSHGNGTKIAITYNPATMVFTVSDNGCGMPVEWSDSHQMHATTVLLGGAGLFAGRNFTADRGETRGLNGVGAKGVVYTSEWFQVEVFRNGIHFEQRFQEGDELIIEAPIIFPAASRKTGTTVRFKLSTKVFPHQLLPDDFVRSRIQEIALCYPNLHVTYNGQRLHADLANLFGQQQPIEFTVAATGITGRFWLLPNYLDNGEFSHSLVNGIPLFGGGVHLDAFRKTFYQGLLTTLERQSKRRNLIPNKADVAEGMVIFNIMQMIDPSFDSQAKSRLINENVGKLIRAALDTEFYKDIIKKHPDWVESIYIRCQQRTAGKDDGDARKKAKKNLRLKVEELRDACGYDRSKCILFLAEGNSAVSGLTTARNPDIHGALPLRGKVLNVFGESAKRIVESEALAKIMNSLGLIVGDRANRHNLRYGKVFIATDADEDGKNISALLINFFYQCWPELFDPAKEPFICVFDTPLIIASKGKQRRYWYNDDYTQFDAQVFKDWEITRAKGLAALKKEDWKHVLDHPKTIPIIDDGALAEALVLLFSPDKSDARKIFIGL